MGTRKLSIGDIVMAVGGALLVLGALLPWFGPKGEHEIIASTNTVNGLLRFSYFGWVTALLGLAAIEIVQLRWLAPDRFKLPIPTAIVGMVAGGLAVVIGVVEMIWQPMFEDAPNEYVDLQWGLFVTVAAGVLVAAGAFLKLADHEGAASPAVPAGPYGAQVYGQAAPAGYAAGTPQAPMTQAYAAPVAQPAPAPAPQPPAAGPDAGAVSAFCGTCGAAMAPDAAFCTNCGTKRG